jgi:glucose-6-phosphate 1-dehydrogenase
VHGDYGGSWDLSTRKLLPTRFGLYPPGDLPEQFVVFSVGLPSLSDDLCRGIMSAACRAALGRVFSYEKWESFSRLLISVGGGFDDKATFETLLSKLRNLTHRFVNSFIHYLAVFPEVTPVIESYIKALRHCSLEFSTRMIMEKPLGHDRESTTEINRVLLDAISERSLYRIDHYLGK